jgi:threonine dehydrogenase-like Zn-dependent dehydrogenase
VAAPERIAFSAPEYQADGSIRVVPYAFAGSTDDGWEIRREGAPHLRLGPGYRLLRVSHCGVCATDLARRHLPFPLPQVTGHEVVALDEDGRPVAVEINASHAGRGLAPEAWCAHCRADLATHCPERLVLGIHALPGGFSPWLLAPVGNVIALPARISPATATLVEPFAAALHAVGALAPGDGARVAVLGPGRLGSLVVAALAAWRRRTGRRFEILAVGRHGGERARRLGADAFLDAGDAAGRRDVADVVVDTTGGPEGFALAARLATREVHLKSTTGQPALGLAHATALVVDELTLVPAHALDPTRTTLPSPAPATAVLLGAGIPAGVPRDLAARGLRIIEGPDARALASAFAADPALSLGAADVGVVTSLADADAAVRPRPGIERGLVRARGTIAVADVGQPRAGLLGPLLDEGIRVTTTRCGDLRAAVDLLADPADDLGRRLGEVVVTDVLPAGRLADAFAIAARPGGAKVLVAHFGGLL